MFLAKAEDFKLNDYFIRNLGDYTFLIKDNNVILSEKKIRLSPIKIELYKGSEYYIEDIRIGVIDVETYDVDNFAKVYALGFLLIWTVSQNYIILINKVIIVMK